MNDSNYFMTSSGLLLETSNIFTSSHVNSYELPFTSAGVIASTFFVVFFFIFGLTANAATIATIFRSSRLKSQYYTILMSLCVSDIVSAFVSIIYLYGRTWGFVYFYWPEFFCRLYWAADFWTSFATAWHILSFAILRLIGVKRPDVFRRITSTTMKMWIAFLWLATFLGGFIPHFIFNTVNDIDRENEPDRARWASCSLSEDWISTWQIYVLLAYAIFIFLPAAGIIVISISITVILHRKRTFPSEKLPTTVSTIADQNHQNSPNISTLGRNKTAKRSCKPVETAAERRWKKNKQAIYQLLLIVGSFLFGYIPLAAFHFYTGFVVKTSDAETNRMDWNFAMVSYLTLRFSECLNPVFYNAASLKMRQETVKFLKKSLSCIPSISKKNAVVSDQSTRQSNADPNDV